MISARELANKKFKGLQLHAPYNELIGVPEISMSCLISGFPGEGKSTLALQLAKELSQYGNVLYVAAEEGTGYTMQEKIRRLGLAGSDVKFTEWEGFSTLKKQIGKNHIDFVVLDSITAMDRYLRDFDDFRQWMKNNGKGLIVVSHSTKAGGYKGDSSLGHDVDTIIELQGGTARTTKNRYGILAEIPVNFGQKKSEDFDNKMKIPSKNQTTIHHKSSDNSNVINSQITRKNPIRSHSDPLIYLGKTLKVTIDSSEGVRTLKGTGKEDRFPMFASLNKHRLYIVPSEFVKQISGQVKSHQAESVYEEWNGYDPDDVDYAIQWPKKGTKAVPVGWANRIWYESDKVMNNGDQKGLPHYYVHKFDKHKRPALVMGNVLVISNLDIDERGILN